MLVELCIPCPLLSLALPQSMSTPMLVTPSPRRILIVVHQETSDPGLVGQWLTHHGYTLDRCTPAIGEPLPTDLRPYDGVVVFGGPMSANDDDKLDFIRAELDWLPSVLAAKKPFLGICLGAQLMARTLGARVQRHPEGYCEMGFYRIKPVPGAPQPHFERPRMVFHWHEEGFELPAGAVQLATGDGFPNQAFRYGDRTFGFQFHPEAYPALVNTWTIRGADMLKHPGSQPRSRQLLQAGHYTSLGKAWLAGFLQDWLHPVATLSRPRAAANPDGWPGVANKP